MVEPFPPNRSLAYTVSGSAAFEKIVRRESLSGSKVLVPAFICEYFLRSTIERYDIEPVFVDVDPETYHIDFDHAEPYLNEVDAVLLVHAFGLPAPVEQWVKPCREHDVVLIEDCARALYARHDGRPVGGFGDYAIFSLSKVSPLYTGGALANAPTQPDVELRSASINADLIVKFVYNAIPYELPQKELIRASYDRIIGDRKYVTQGTERTLLGADNSLSVRQLDPLNQWLFERYLRREFPRALGEQRSIAASLRTELESYGFEVQPDSDGRVHYVLSATVPGNRDELVEYLRSRGNQVQFIWDEPWGLTAENSGTKVCFPGTRYLANNIVTFPITNMTHDDVLQLTRDLRAYYGREETARSHSPDHTRELRHD